MFDDYRDIVFAAYKRKRDERPFSFNLRKPTPASLRAECLNVYIESAGSTKDDDTLRSFFGPKQDALGFGKNIERLPVSKYKPLANFLTEKTLKTDGKNIELLAWLINFEDRPYKIGKKYERPSEMADPEYTGEPIAAEPELIAGDFIITGKQQQDSGEGVDELNTDDYKRSNEKIEGKEKEEDDISLLKHEIQQRIQKVKDGERIGAWKRSIRNAIASFALIIAAGGGVYFLNNNAKQCMYWTGEYYQPVSCNEKIDNIPVIALDEQKIKHLRKITRPDTLTRYSLGKVWYIKVDGVPEFFTAAGDYPLDDRKRLLPITPYILNKYVRGN